MSMYNTLFGVNPFAGILLKALDLEVSQIPRFRDCFLNEEGKIVIYTRTGGGNRDYYDAPNEDNQEGPFNKDLREVSGFVRDYDDDFDSTYAYFVYEVPAAFKSQIELLTRLGSVRDPAKAWQKVIQDLQAGEDTPETRRALEVGKQIAQQIEQQLKDQS